MTLLDNIKTEQNFTLTENGALALDHTSDVLTDLFAVSGALRQRSDFEITSMFAKAMAEDNLLATKLAFYTRDVRGGLGERRTGRLMLKFLADHYPDIFNKNLEHIAEYSDGKTERGRKLRETICEKFNFDSLEFQSLEGVLEAIGIDPCKLCTYCWNGRE